MVNKVSMSMSKCIGETEEYALGYKHGLSAGIYNTLVFLEKKLTKKPRNVVIFTPMNMNRNYLQNMMGVRVF